MREFAARAARALLLAVLMIAIAVPGNVVVEYPVQYVPPSAVRVTTSATI